MLKVALPPQMIEAQLDAGYDVATRRHVKVLLTTGEAITGHVVVFRPPGRDRLSDYAQIDERFRYVELADRTLLINSAHIVALTEVTNLERGRRHVEDAERHVGPWPASRRRQPRANHGCGRDRRRTRRAIR